MPCCSVAVLSYPSGWRFCGRQAPLQFRFGPSPKRPQCDDYVAGWPWVTSWSALMHSTKTDRRPKPCPPPPILSRPAEPHLISSATAFKSHFLSSCHGWASRLPYSRIWFSRKNCWSESVPTQFCPSLLVCRNVFMLGLWWLAEIANLMML